MAVGNLLGSVVGNYRVAQLFLALAGLSKAAAIRAPFSELAKTRQSANTRPTAALRRHDRAIDRKASASGGPLLDPRRRSRAGAAWAPGGWVDGLTASPR